MLSDKEEIVGTWNSDPNASESEVYGQTTLIFHADGTLLYIVHELKRDQIMRLTYELKNGVIITDQPSAPRSERTEYGIDEDGVLHLAFGGRKSRYFKVR